MRRKLFLADDSVTIQRVVELTFSGEDIEVVTVSDGEEAIARLSAEAPDIVLADIAMPKKNGYEVAAFMKEHPTLSRVPVLLLAGAFEPVDEERAKRVKCDGVLIDGARPAEETAPAAPPPHGQGVEMPQRAPAPAPRADQSLDEYFDRLDVAFATRAQNPPRPFPHLSTPGPESVDPPEALTPPAFPAEPAAATANVIADLFKLFFEVEQGERDVASVRIPDEIERIRRRNTIE